MHPNENKPARPGQSVSHARPAAPPTHRLTRVAAGLRGVADGVGDDVHSKVAAVWDAGAARGCRGTLLPRSLCGEVHVGKQGRESFAGRTAGSWEERHDSVARRPSVAADVASTTRSIAFNSPRGANKGRNNASTHPPSNLPTYLQRNWWRRRRRRRRRCRPRCPLPRLPGRRSSRRWRIHGSLVSTVRTGAATVQ